jgi:diguanylate cyclase (GGDEF)-like protein
VDHRPFLLLGAFLLMGIIAQAAMTSLKGKNSVLDSESKTDVLTGLWNRREFDQRLKLEWARSRREDLALIMVDVDFFKEVNDNYGHSEGDYVLQTVARAIAKACHRASDAVCRFGGDEFAIILPATALPGANKIANEIIQNIRNLQIPHDYRGDLQNIVTCTIGVANVVPEKGNPQSLLDVADKALYQAKERGRDAVVAYHLPISGEAFELSQDFFIKESALISDEEIERIR